MHSVYSLYYQSVQFVKYRRKVFGNDAIMDLLKTKTRKIAYSSDVDILDMECDKDHSHMLFRALSRLNIPQFINAVKMIKSKGTQHNFPDVLNKNMDSREMRRNENL